MEIAYHDRLWVSTKRVLEEASQLGVTVRNVTALAIDEGGYDVSKGRKREVNLRCLLQTLTRSTGLCLAFRTLKKHYYY